ncbi:copper chaperone PCu(A)C [Alteraurantiacibacter palmitatis]|uniref:Copper chaperone PCu(A)C n=1 Tax=Alteraurantiacibacter palmitatis TaxID=2054628 RepID=A0ABV7E222_9SPHN
MRKAFIASLGGIALVMGLAACSSESEAPVEAAPEAPEGITVTDGRMNLPAAAGNPSAVYFTITNDSAEDKMLRAVSVQGAENAMFHETSEWSGQVDMQELLQVAVPAGESVVFEPGGKHVMVFGLPEGLEPGGEVEVTLSFVRGDKVTFPARLLAPGDTGAAN